MRSCNPLKIRLLKLQNKLFGPSDYELIGIGNHKMAGFAMAKREDLVERTVPSAALSGAPVEALGSSDEFLDFQQRLARAAKAPRPVLLVGERGTGKELAASRLHYLSPRWGGPFIKLNCAALSPNVLESELFGHEAGAFTGAVKQRRGRFEAAHGGTLFLDEIAQMPIELQEKILRAVEYGSFERVGSSESIEVDVRLVGATNADLPALAAAGKFRRDLLDRLSFEVLFLPPLRDRPGDIELLANYFASRMAAELGLPELPRFTEKAEATLRSHDWPGNVRELKNAVERAVSRTVDGGNLIREIILDPFIAPFAMRLEAPPGAPSASAPATAAAGGALNLLEAVSEFEKRLLLDGLEQARHNQRKAADLLGLTYDQFRGLYRKYGPATNP
jgi:psp operon transcriptional activator